jgi:DDE superfamily endonuclease
VGQDGVRDDIGDDLIEHLGDPGVVLVVDETGDLKNGTTTVGVQRHGHRTAGRIENAQVAVLLVDASRAALVAVAAPTAGLHSGLPLPPARQRTVKITISGWSTDVERRVKATFCLVDGMISAQVR